MIDTECRRLMSLKLEEKRRMRLKVNEKVFVAYLAAQQMMICASGERQMEDKTRL